MTQAAMNRRRPAAPALATALCIALALVGCASAPPAKPVAPLPAPPTSPAPPASPAPLPQAPPPTQAQIDAKRQAEFDKSLASWHGASTRELRSKLGLPTSTAKQADGVLVYVYAKSSKVNGPTGPTGFSCVVRYLIDEKADRVVGHRIEGC